MIPSVLDDPRGSCSLPFYRCMRREAPDLRLLVSGADPSAGVVQSYAQQVLQRVGAEAGHELQPQVQTAAASRATLDVRSRLWYNPRLDYDDFMAPGILAILVTLIGTLLTAQNIAREQEIGTIEQLNVTPITKGSSSPGSWRRSGCSGCSSSASACLSPGSPSASPCKGACCSSSAQPPCT